jgi:hypothetical protein
MAALALLPLMMELGNQSRLVQRLFGSLPLGGA